MRLPLY
jgi:hypothetical protein